MDDMKEKLNEFLEGVDKCREILPKQTDLFLTLARNIVGTEGALDKKTKRLIALALAVSAGCEWCIAYHVDGAFKEGATKEEMAEAGFVSVLMNGGPSIAYMHTLLKSIEDLS